jgi:phosphatidylserine decarboxylase
LLDDYFKTKIPEFNIHNTLLVARPGIIFILIAFVPLLIFWLLDLTILRNIFFIIFLFVIWFFRDPFRVVPPEGFAVSPADGKIIRIEKKAVCPITGEVSTKISIFMNIFSVHVNRVPLSGTVKAIHYYKGTLVNASFDKASLNNERNVFHFKDNHGRDFVLVQIAGLIARRIVCWVKKDEPVERGQRFGMIRFGSRVDIYLPPDAIVMVSLGQNVIAGTSPIWRFPET